MVLDVLAKSVYGMRAERAPRAPPPAALRTRQWTSHNISPPHFPVRISACGTRDFRAPAASRSGGGVYPQGRALPTPEERPAQSRRERPSAEGGEARGRTRRRARRPALRRRIERASHSRPPDSWGARAQRAAHSGRRTRGASTNAPPKSAPARAAPAPRAGRPPDTRGLLCAAARQSGRSEPAARGRSPSRARGRWSIAGGLGKGSPSAPAVLLTVGRRRTR